MILADRIDVEQLTAREAELVALMLSGTTSDRALAETMVVSEHTVHWHIGGVMRKLQVNNRTQLVAFAASNGRVEGGRWLPNQ